MKDRVSKYPGRALITPEDGSAPFYATITRADEPTQAGDPMGKVTFLKDDTAALFGMAEDAVPDDVFAWIGEWGKSRWKLLAEFNTAGTHTFVVPDDVNELGVLVLGGGGSGGAACPESERKVANAQGGSSGQIVQRILKIADGDFVKNEAVSVVVGAGGASVNTTGATAGKNGGTSAFKEVTAEGGAGGGAVQYTSPSLPQPDNHLGQASDYAARSSSDPAPYGLVAFYNATAVPGGPVFYPIRPSVPGYGARNIFDENDMHVYCGAGGCAYMYSGTAPDRIGQSVITRARGSAGAGRTVRYSSDPNFGANATAPGDGGGAICGSSSYSISSGAGADGLVLVYGRKVV